MYPFLYVPTAGDIVNIRNHKRQWLCGARAKVIARSSPGYFEVEIERPYDRAGYSGKAAHRAAIYFRVKHDQLDPVAGNYVPHDKLSAKELKQIIG